MTTQSQRHTLRTRKDIIARRLVTLFGCSVLVLLLVIVWHLIARTVPLFSTPQFIQQDTLSFDNAEIVDAGDLLDGGILVQKAEPCGLVFDAVNTQAPAREYYMQPCNHSLTIAAEQDQRWLFDVSEKGLVRVRLMNSPNQAFTFALPEKIWQQQQYVEFAVSLPQVAVLVTTQAQHHVFWFNTTQPTLLDENRFSLTQEIVLLPARKEVVSYQDNEFIITPKGRQKGTRYNTSQPIKSIHQIENSRSLFISNEQGTLSRWVISNRQGQFVFSPTYRIQLDNNEYPLTVKSHADTNAAIVLTDRNRLLLINRVSGEVLHAVALDHLPLAVNWYGSRVYLVYKDNVQVMSMTNSAGITTLATLFSAQSYEGYATPEHVYQTTSGSDFQEAKYALAPLLIGSFKAALAALFVAIPLSLGAAVYTGFFARPRLRNTIKPVIEMLEAVPSVVLGFIAAVSLAPLAEELLVALLFFLVTIPFLLLAIALFQHRISRKMPKSIRFGSEILVAALGIVLWGAVSLSLAAEGLPQDTFVGLSKTTIIVAVALGVAISPTIYTLSEDAIESVPVNLKNASFALGATRLQTLRNIVLRVSMPGLIAAVMLGFGRAFGETMIVLMVTGNTPIPSWDLFESLRALTANLAIELPEADTGSTLYAILFFTALTLFIFTFLVNTIAEWLRHNMRESIRYD